MQINRVLIERPLTALGYQLSSIISYIFEITNPWYYLDERIIIVNGSNMQDTAIDTIILKYVAKNESFVLR